MDILIYGSLYRNDYPNQGNRVQLKLTGSPENQVNMDCYGTRVNVYAGGKLYHRQLSGSAGGSRCVQNSNVLHFGIGDNSMIDSILIYYPNSEIHKLIDINPNAIYLIPYKGEPERLGIFTASLLNPKQFSFGEPVNSNISWLESYGATDYILEVYKDRKMQDLYLKEIVSSKTNLDYEFNNNSTYFWRVKSVNTNDTSNFSSLWQFTVGNEIPEKIVVTNPSNEQIDLSVKPTFQWTIPKYICDYCYTNSYEIEILENSNPAIIVANRSNLKDSIFVLDSALKPNTTYNFRVRAKNKTEYGEWSDYIMFTTMPAPPKPQLLLPNDKAVEIEDRPKYQWEAVENAESYELQTSADPDFNEIFYSFDNLKSTVFRNLGKRLFGGTQYFWRIRAYNLGGPGDWSDVWSFTTGGEKPNVDDFDKIFSVSINPNPVERYLNLNISSSIDAEILVNIIDIHGNTLIKNNIFVNTNSPVIYNFDMHQFTSGIYFIKILSGKYTKTMKISVID